MGKYGILGGTFNPMHFGHLILAEQAYSEFGLDKVLIIPSGNSYFKENTGVLPAGTRFEMCRIAIEDNEHFELSDIEVNRAGETYTYETLEQLSEILVGEELFFICGADVVSQMKLWKCPEKIFEKCSVIAAVRDNTDFNALSNEIKYYEDKFNAKIMIMNCGRMDISSTEIRKKIAYGLSVKYYLPDKLIEFIKSNNLYQHL